MIKLEILTGPLSGEHRLFRHSPVRIGSGVGCDLVWEAGGRGEARPVLLRWDAGQVTLEVPRGAEGVSVNGHPVRQSALLEPGDQLQLGGLALRFRWVEPPRPVTRRRRSVLEGLTTGAAAVLLVSQLVLLAFLAPDWRQQVDSAVLRPRPAPPPPAQEEAAPDAEPEAGGAEPLPDPAPPAGVPEAEDPSPLPLATPTPVPSLPPVPTPTPMPLTETLSADEQVDRVRDLIRERNFLEAERLLAQIRRQHPGHVQAAVEQARLMGRQSRFQEGIDAWEEVRRLVDTGSAEDREAAIEIPLLERRLRQLERPLPAPPPPRSDPPPRPLPDPLPQVPPPRAPSAPAVEPAPVSPRAELTRNPSLLVGDIAVQRLLDQSVADMREVRFNLQHVFGAPPVAAGRARAVVRFYESDGQRFFPANIPNPEVSVRINRELARGETLRDVRAIYQVPRGTRSSAAASFHGVVIRVFIGDRLEHELALPSTLLQIEP